MLGYKLGLGIIIDYEIDYFIINGNIVHSLLTHVQLISNRLNIHPGPVSSAVPIGLKIIKHVKAD